ncbi:hypothetical protein CWE09_06105 [Aliidiomarina minuta]|uniref:Uncharacterized protein n=1 Tax=Aliidiomarina minuta TaxID=880057 RepID=A0A432W8J2_9GAMM|nr:hypothetical protein [Aliidiomarina minuta]RUO26286.1 hypothetical protein CWE09_06105 [Aliidiomarina minuta]
MQEKYSNQSAVPSNASKHSKATALGALIVIGVAAASILSACGGSNDNTSNDTGQTASYRVTVEHIGEGSVSQSSLNAQAGQTARFVVSPSERMVTESISSEQCTLDVVGDVVTVTDVQADCTVQVTFDDCIGCYAKEDVILDYTPSAELMARNCVRGGLVATGSDNVNWHNLCQAAETLQTMLSQNSDVTQRLQENGAITALFGDGENVCDLPYFAFLEGQPQCTEAVGGLGGVPGNPVTACNAKTLSAVNDPFERGQRHGENTCVHELAHTIMNVGVGFQLNQEIYRRYDDVIAEGRLWVRDNGEPSFALQNGDELFAELAQSYFNANVAVDFFNHTGVNGAEELADYDPVSFELVDRIFMRPADLR